MGRWELWLFSLCIYRGGACLCMCTCWGQRSKSGSSVCCFLLPILWQAHTLNAELTDWLEWLASMLFSRRHPVPASPVLGLQIHAVMTKFFYVGSRSELRSSNLYSKQFTTWVICLACLFLSFLFCLLELRPLTGPPASPKYCDCRCMPLHQAALADLFLYPF